MANITITINDAIATDVLNAVCKQLNYDTLKLDGETKVQYVKRKTAGWYKAMYQNQLALEAAEAAKATSLASTNNADIS
jgi:hypothetical protein